MRVTLKSAFPRVCTVLLVFPRELGISDLILSHWDTQYTEIPHPVNLQITIYKITLIYN